MSSLGDDPFRKREPEGSGPGQPPPSEPSGAGRGYPGASGYPPGYPPPPGYSPPPGYPPYPPAGGYPPPGYPGGYPPPSPSGPRPPSNLGWAITAVVFFWPLAIASFINYAKIEGLWYHGDYAGAQQASDATKRYGVIALCIGIGLFLLWLGFAVTVVNGFGG